MYEEDFDIDTPSRDHKLEDRRSVPEETEWSGGPHWIGLLIKYRRLLITGVLLLGVIYLLDHFGAIGSVKSALLMLLTSGICAGWLYLVRITTHYVVTNKRITDAFGIINKSDTDCTYRQITNVNVRQTILERVLKLGNIQIDTANDSANITWYGVRDPKGVKQRIDNHRIDFL